MSWNIEGKYVTGIYLGLFPVAGTVTESRVKYGGDVCHTVSLKEPIKVFGVIRETVILNDQEIYYTYESETEQNAIVK